MIWLIFVGIFVVGIYWLSSKSRGRSYHNPKSQEEHLRLLEQERTEAEIQHRAAELRRQRFGWRRR